MSESEHSDSESDIDMEEAVLVQQCLNDYNTKREATRKKRIDAMSEKEELIVSPQDIAGLTLTKKQIAQLKREQKEKDKQEKKERTEKQKQQLAELNERKRKQLDLRKSKEEEGIVLKINKTQIRKKKSEKPLPKIKEVVVSDDEEEPKSFQGKKPNLDDIEEKVKKLDMINQVIASDNPYLAMILKNRKR